MNTIEQRITSDPSMRGLASIIKENFALSNKERAAIIIHRLADMYQSKFGGRLVDIRREIRSLYR